jgi:hypothetical protein
MFASYGPVAQLGYVVRDIGAAMRVWSEQLRIGPWFYNSGLKFSTYRFRGTAYDGMEIAYALSNSGELQIELIQQIGDTPSLYLEHLERHGEGLQHYCVWPEDYDAAYALACGSGLVPAQEGSLGRIRFVYFENAGHGGTSLELSEMGPGRRAGIARIRNAAAAWDGSDAVRDYP